MKAFVLRGGVLSTEELPGFPDEPDDWLATILGKPESATGL